MLCCLLLFPFSNKSVLLSQSCQHLHSSSQLSVVQQVIPISIQQFEAHWKEEEVNTSKC